MKTSPTDAQAGAATLLLFAGAGGAPTHWLLLDGEGVTEGEGWPAPAGWSRAVLAVPGEQVTVHWLELAEGLTQPQAAAAARLMLADASAEPLSDMHVVVGRPERGLTPVALVPTADVAGWLAAAAAAGVEPEWVLPSPMLLPVPEQGFVRRDKGEIADFRGPAAAFSLEPDMAEALVADAPVAVLDGDGFAAALWPVLADPPLNLRQGIYSRRRQWRLQAPRLRRMALLAAAFALLTLAVQVATILSYTFAADRIEAEAEALAAAPGAAGEAGPGFGGSAAVLFEAVRTTPNVEVTRIDYRADGSLVATVMMDGPATLAALQARIEASGLAVEPGEQRTAGGRPTADLIVRPA